MIDEKQLDGETADRIGEYVRRSGGIELIDILLADPKLTASKAAVAGLEAMKLLLGYCGIFNLAPVISFDLSLARGLDYYTGVIYEAVLKAEPPAPVAATTKDDEAGGSVGSVAGGGRYDNLVGMFDPRGKQVPCVGVSIGVERIFAVLEAKQAIEKRKIRTTEIDVYVASAHKGLHERRLQILSQLWDAGVRSEHSYKLNPKLLVQLQHCEEQGIPFALVLGDSELERGVVKFREVATRKEEEIGLENLAADIVQRLRQLKVAQE